MDFKPSNGFFDLCINVSGSELNRLKDILSRLYEFGYRTVALNQIVDENIFNTDKKKKKKDDENKVLPKDLPNPIDVQKLSEEFGDLCVLNRITFACSDPAKTHTLARCATLKKYDLYAIVPKNQAMLQFACSQLNADLIAMRLSSSAVKLNRKLYQQAVERGLSFEIQYADLLIPETRQLAIYYSHLFYTYGKSKNVIVSSGANHANLIRNPYDIINLGCLLGLNEIRSKAAVLTECQLLLLRAEKRLSGKAIFTVQFTKDTTVEDTLEEECLDT